MLSQSVDVVHGPSNRSKLTSVPELQETQKKLEDDMKDSTLEMKAKPSQYKSRQGDSVCGAKKTHFLIPKLPLDKNCTKGCDNEVCDDMDLDNKLTQMVKTNHFWSNLHQQTELDPGQVCTNEMPL